MSARARPLRIMLVCHSYPPVIGGSEIEAQRVCSALLRRGHQVTVVAAGGDPMPPVRDWVDPKGVPVRLYGGRWSGAAKDYVFAVEVARLLWRERRSYDVVYFLMQGMQLATGLPVARLLRKAIVMKIAGSSVIPLLTRSRTGRLELRWLKQWAHKIMILNQGMRDEALAEGFSPDRLYWMPNPVDIEEFAPASPEERAELRRRLGIRLDAHVVLFLGRLAPEKALPTLLDAFARVVRRVPQAMLVLAGDGPVRAALEQQAAALGLDDGCVRFAGRIHPDDVRSWLRAADLFTLVSLNEGLPCALLEAMATGLASVVSDIPANRQLVTHGEHGLRVPAGDVEAIASAIMTLLEDAQMRMRMGAGSRQRMIESYSTESVVGRYETMLAEVLAATQSP